MRSSSLSSEQRGASASTRSARTQIAGFPTADLTKTDAWSRAPRTRVLPDRFVLLLYRTEDVGAARNHRRADSRHRRSSAPTRSIRATTLVDKDDALTLGGDCDWMSDFNAAVRAGAGLSRAAVGAGSERAVSPASWCWACAFPPTPTQGAAMLEELIANHQFSPKGFSLVPQGTPTNNTERNGTGYSDNDPYDDLAFFTEVDPPAFDPPTADPLQSQTDGRLLADALGIGYSDTADRAERGPDRRARGLRDEHGAVSVHARLLAQELDGAGRHARGRAADARRSSRSTSPAAARCRRSAWAINPTACW